MERRMLLSTVAVALVLGTVAASAQTRRPPERNQAPPQAAQPQQNAPMPQAQQNMPAQPNMPNAQQPAPSATTGQAAPPTQPNQSNAASQPQQPPAGQAQTQPQPGTAAQGQGQAQGQPQPGMTQGNTAGANTGVDGNQLGVITLNAQQNTRVSLAIRQANVQPLTNVSFSIAVGTPIPADVQLQVLPPALVEIVPQFNGFSFVLVEREVLIIHPNTRAIVAVVPFDAQQTTGANQAAPPPPAPAQAAAPPPPREPKKIDLTRDQREIQRRQAERHRQADTKSENRTQKRITIEERRATTGAGPREPRVGDRVPDSAVIEGRPVEVYREAPPVRDDRPHPSVRDIPLIGPLFGPPHED